MTNNSINIVRIILSALLATVSCSVAQAQADASQYVRMTSEDVIICDNGDMSMDFDINMPSTNPITINYTMWRDGVPLETVFRDVPPANLNEGKGSFSIVLLGLDTKSDPKGRHVQYKYTYTITCQALGLEDSPIGDVFTVDVWATPQARITKPADDLVCGFEVELQGNPEWNDVSAYKWSTASGNVTFDDDMAFVCSASLNDPSERDEVFTLRESTGKGKCYSEDVRKLTFKRLPEASIAAADNSAQFLCSTIADDARYAFDVVLGKDGNGPFDIYLSDGEILPQTSVGSEVKGIRVPRPEDVYIADVIDVNGCHAVVRDGLVKVVDRKPKIAIPTDTVEFEGRHIKLTRELSDTGDLTENGAVFSTGVLWEVNEVFHRHGQFGSADNVIDSDEWSWDSDNATTYRLRTNKTGLLAIDYTEVNHMDSEVYGEDMYEDCPYTVRQYVSSYDAVNAPNGFSPNGDLKNDYLVIEGLPDNNRLIVYDSTGKIVHDETNYRNTWKADGLDDGYYVYVFEGEGIKTVKKTLVIKRAKKY